MGTFLAFASGTSFVGAGLGNFVQAIGDNVYSKPALTDIYGRVSLLSFLFNPDVTKPTPAEYPNSEQQRR